MNPSIALTEHITWCQLNGTMESQCGWHKSITVEEVNANNVDESVSISP